MPSVLITGGTRGIGLALAKAFLHKGWQVTACYHEDAAAAEQAQGELSAIGPDALLVQCDVARQDAVEEMAEAALGRWGGLDCAIHNAGATWNARILNIEEERWNATMEVHLKGAFHLSKSVLRPMLKRKGGHLIFIDSVVATTGNIGQGSYTAAKAGIVGFMRSVAREYGPRNIRANAVCPGFHKTRIADNLSPEAEEAIRRKHLLGRTTDLDEVCQFVTWLAGTRTISGQVFNLDSRLPGWL